VVEGVVKQMKAPPFTAKATRHFLLILLFLSAALHAEPPKEALLIANGKYSHFGSLAHPLPDAVRLGAVLEKIGFRVTTIQNGSREEMLDALKEFETRLQGTGAIAFFHYGGHGVQVDGRNYLIPADADIPDERRVATRAVDLDEIMGALDQAHSRANVVVLDACRDNPLPALAGRAGARGLTVVGAKPKNSIIIFAAEAGNKAVDGLFTPILAEALEAPGRTIDQIMKTVRSQVHARSQGQQIPGEYNQLFEDLFLWLAPEGLQDSSLPANNFEQQQFLLKTAEIKNELANQSAETITDAIAAGNLDLASSALMRFSELAPADSRVEDLRLRLKEALQIKSEKEKQANSLPPDLPASGYFNLGEIFKGGPYAGYNSYSRKIILQRAQETLRKRNLYSASGDGSPGPKTQQAIIEFQCKQGIPVSGRLDSVTLSGLALGSLAEIPAPTPKPQSLKNSPRNSYNYQNFPYSMQVTGKPGFVISPHAPQMGYVDVRGFQSGTEVKCPYTGRIFLVP
jgi:peptidoglycan hydrolase-like protein with peptidoglycan-binding domain